MALVDVDRVRLEAFALAEDHRAFDGETHSHTKHQLLYCAEGSLELFTGEGRWMLPPQRAALLLAGTAHRVRCSRSIALRTVYLARNVLAARGTAVRVFSVAPLLREMILFSMRWGPSRPAKDPTAHVFFRALAKLLDDWAEDSAAYRLPAPKTPEIAAAMDIVLADPASAPALPALARRVALSPRSLERRLRSEVSLTFRDLVRAARLQHAMSLLAAPGARVTDVALACGFENVSSFTRSFSAFVGETPSAFRGNASDVDLPDHRRVSRGITSGGKSRA
jgi:AraC-like DNA-binding protein